ncbi:MAG: DNA primase, partial [Candidatus Eisenbacteria bacterium]|nr:DNA primase [Candidatus Eisenbacteria bacterium]
MSLPARGTPLRSDEWIERVRDANDIVEVIGQTVVLKRAGRNWVGVCPFHKEKSPSFSVNSERQFYHCFGCKAGGDVFRFVMETEKIGFVEAAEMLSRRAGIAIPERRPGERGQRTAALEALEAAAVAYEQWLADPERGGAARAYLEQRGITRETQRAFRLGLAPTGWTPLIDRLRDRISEEALLEAGLVAKREQRSGVYDRFRDRLMVPLLAPGGTVVGFGGRTLGEDGPKYLNSPETSIYHKGQFLYGFDVARRPAEAAGEFVLVEGYFDVIALHQAGVTHAIASSGTALTADQARAMKRVVSRVALTFDGDDAGREAMLRSLDVLMAEGLEVAILPLAAGQDPDTFVREHGSDGWGRLRAAGLDPVEFIQRHEESAGGV